MRHCPFSIGRSSFNIPARPPNPPAGVDDMSKTNLCRVCMAGEWRDSLPMCMPPPSTTHGRDSCANRWQLRAPLDSTRESNPTLSLC